MSPSQSEHNYIKKKKKSIILSIKQIVEQSIEDSID